MPIALVLSIALLSAHFSVHLRADTFAAVFKGEFDTFAGRPLHPEFQNRVLSPSLLAALRYAIPASISDKSVWFAVRTIEASLAYLVLYGVALRLCGSRLRAFAAVSLVAYVYFWTTLSHPAEYTSDFFDILFTALFVRLALAERWLPFGLVVAIAALNRESAAFGGVVSIGLATARFGPWPENWRRFAPGILLIIEAAVVVLGLRYLLAGTLHAQQLGVVDLVANWRWVLYPDGQLPMLVSVLLAVAIVLIGLPRPWTIDQRGLLLGFTMSAVISCIFGIAAELRVWLPCATILSLLAVIGANGKDDTYWLTSLVKGRR